MKSRIVRTSFPLLAALAMVALFHQSCSGQEGSSTPAPMLTLHGPLAPARAELIHSYRLPKRERWYNLRGPMEYVVQYKGAGEVIPMNKHALRDLRKALKKRNTVLKDVRPYEEAHPLADKIQTGCRRWDPVIGVGAKLAQPAAILGAGELAKTKQEVQVVGQ